MSGSGFQTRLIWYVISLGINGGIEELYSKMKIIEIAENIARKAHQGQYRKDGITPYITHPERVADRLSTDTDAQTVAWLHDVLEDTGVSEASLIAAGIAENIVLAVTLLTKSDGIDYEDYLIKVRDNDLALKVKIEDMLDNLLDSPTKKQIVKYARGLLILLS